MNKRVRWDMSAMGMPSFVFWPSQLPQLQNDPKILDQDNQQSYTKILSTRKMRSQLQGPSALNQVLGQHCYFTNVDEPIHMPPSRKAHHPHPTDLCTSPNRTPSPTSLALYTPFLPFILDLPSQNSFHLLILTEKWIYPEGTACPESLTSGSYFSHTLPANGPRADIVASLICISFQITDPLSCL